MKKIFKFKSFVSLSTILLVANSLLFPLGTFSPINIAQAHGGGNYSITGSATVTNFSVTVAGTASAVPYVGQCSDQHVAIDWGTNGDSIPNNWVYAAYFNKVCDYYNKHFHDAAWGGSKTYLNPGTYHIFVRVYHAQPTGAEGSDIATLPIDITIPSHYCGDGVLDAGEQCDDGNKVDGDGCSASCTIEIPVCTDADQDGYYAEGCQCGPTDCNDTDAAVNPGASETCNGIDDNCNAQVDEGVQSTFYQDSDGDTYGNLQVTTQACSAPTGYVSDNTDCNDANPAVNPAANEVCNGVDDNCSGQTDEGEVCPANSYYCDGDQDTYFSAVPSGNCDSYDCVPIECTVNQGNDCNDTDAAINPGAAETCNGIDDNCNAQIDEGVQSTFYQDADGDTYGNLSVTMQACSAPTGYVSDNTDCNDANSAINPAANEICDGLDNNCNAQIDEGVQLTFYQDSDGDTYGNLQVTTQACSAPTGYVSDNTDCNDANATINPGATEICGNDIDEDCSGVDATCPGPQPVCGNNIIETGEGCDDGNTISGDGCSATCTIEQPQPGCTPETTTTCSTGLQGICSAGIQTCSAENIWGTCTQINSSTTEICGNGLDDDCDSVIDNGCQTPPVLYCGDGSCNNGETCSTCSQDCGSCGGGGGVSGITCGDSDSDGYCVYNPVYCTACTDCNDGNANINPLISEVCDDGIDNNCNGLTDCADTACANAFNCQTGGGQPTQPTQPSQPSLTIYNERAYGIGQVSANIEWLTNLESTSQIIYSASGQGHTLDTAVPPYYGYANAYPVPAESSMVINHGLFLAGLQTCTDYYYRVVSSLADTPTFSPEYSFTTLCAREAITPPPAVAGEETEEIEEQIPAPETTSEGQGQEIPAPQAEAGNRYLAFLADIGDILSNFFGKIFGCIPWWLIILLALYSLIKGLRTKNEGRKNGEISIWIAWTLIVVLLVIYYYYISHICLKPWVFLILLVITLLIRWFVNKNHKA